MNAIEQDVTVYFVLFIILYHVVLSFETVDKILKCDYSTESCHAVFSCGTVCSIQLPHIKWTLHEISPTSYY